MTRNLTLRIDETLLKRMRHVAVDEGVSVSALVIREMERRVSRSSGQARKRARALHMLDKPLRLKGLLLSREALHER